MTIRALTNARIGIIIGPTTSTADLAELGQSPPKRMKKKRPGPGVDAVLSRCGSGSSGDVQSEVDVQPCD